MLIDKKDKMKFIHYLEKIGGVDAMGVASLVGFFVFFLVMLTWVFKTRKKKFNDISRIPLDN